jgi:hypothetical protein
MSNDAAHNNYYVQFINSCWPGVFVVDPTMITQSVKLVAEQVWVQIRNCSQSLAIFNAFYDLFYSNTSLAEVLYALDITIIVPKPTIPGWFEQLIGANNGAYYTCYIFTANTWKTAMGLALLDMFELSEDGTKLKVKDIDLKNLPFVCPVK